MTTTFQVDANSVEAIKFIEFARTLPFVKEKKTKHGYKQDDVRAMTMEEFHAKIDSSEKDIAAGRVVSNDEMGRWISQL